MSVSLLGLATALAAQGTTNAPPPPILVVPVPPPVIYLPIPVPPPPPAPPPVTLDTPFQRAVLIKGRIREKDYPAAALRNEEQGRVMARITIDRRGAVTQCSPEGATAVLRAASCRIILERFRFRPARNYKRKRIASEVIQPVHWILPDY